MPYFHIIKKWSTGFQERYTYWPIQCKQNEILTNVKHTGNIFPKSTEALMALFSILLVLNPELHQQHSPKPLMQKKQVRVIIILHQENLEDRCSFLHMIF